MSTRKITCPKCNGRGRVVDYLDEVRCEHCKGHGTLVVDDCSHCDGRGYRTETARAEP